MSDIKKFLDYEGVQHLWSKINMNDYPNNETLMAVINAIDETKADKSDLPKIATDDDVFNLLVETDIIEPVYSNNNEIFTDSEGNIFCL